MRIHLINPMTRFGGGSEWRLYELYNLLRSRSDDEVCVWSYGQYDDRWCSSEWWDSSGWWGRKLSIRHLQPTVFPRDGVVVFVGVYYEYGSWLSSSHLDRVVIVYNTDNPDFYTRSIEQARKCQGAQLDVVYASSWIRDSVGGSGPVQPSIVDTEKFHPSSDWISPFPEQKRCFIVGRHSRDEHCKHHHNDLAFYSQLCGIGMRVRVLGGRCLRYQGSVPAGVELLPECAEEASSFLRGLDCFFYRTNERFMEAHGRAVQEAMACGLPVVCSNQKGFSEYITHNKNGFLFDTQDQVFEILRRLSTSPALCLEVGQAARQSMLRLFSDESLDSIAEYYLQGSKSSGKETV